MRMQVKFYTRQGNWDLMGLHMPVRTLTALRACLKHGLLLTCMRASTLTWAAVQVFFIRDAAQFPDLMHALSASPDTGVAEAWRTADLLSFHPEAMNMV